MRSDRLILLVAFVVFLAQLAWITFLPLFQAPDEQAHFAQVQNKAELNLDYKMPPNISKEILFAEEKLGVLRNERGDNKFTYHPEFNIEYSQTVIGPYERQIDSLPKSDRTEFAINESTDYPLLYYQIGSLFYKLGYNGSLFDRVFAVRLMTGLIGVLIFIVVYLIGRVLYKEPSKQISLAILTSFAPMFMFVNSGVTSDSLFNLIFPVFLLLCLLLIKKGLNIACLLGIGIVFILGINTKPQANIMAFVFAPLLFLLFLKTSKKLYFLPIVFGAVVLLFEEIIKRAVNGISILPEASSVKFSLGTLIEHFRFTLNHTYREVLPWYWGVFRWLSLGLPQILRQITNVVTIASFACFAVYLFGRRKFTEEVFLKGFMFFALVIYFFAITAFDFGFRQSHGFSFGIQGRYFFPVAAVISMIIIDGLGFLFERIGNDWHVVPLDVGVILFNVTTFFYLMFSYYSREWPAFFIQASQYKPLWLKYPVNLVILGVYLLSALWTCLLLLRHTTKKR